MPRLPAKLVLEDGRVFHGESFGSSGTRTGEACFNTSMTGYQEVLTDPSYRGQIVAMTCPHIGNYGVNAIDEESSQPHVRGFVIEELCRHPSNWRSEEGLEGYLHRWNVMGIQGVDTRALTRHLRVEGALRAVLSSDPELSDAEAAAMAAASEGTLGMDFVREVTTAAPYHWDPDGQLSGLWSLRRPLPANSGQLLNQCGESFEPLPPARRHVVAYDFGIKRNILRRLRQSGLSVQVVPARTSAADVLAMDPDGIFLSNGPGDPSALDSIHAEVRKLLGRKPVFAICLGHQILGHALGGRTFKLRFGHRGGNQPVQDLRTGQVTITSQNHGYAVDADSLPSGVEVTHINLNDGTVEGLRHRDYPMVSIQYHPEAAPGPHDARYFFSEFANLIEESSGRG